MGKIKKHRSRPTPETVPEEVVEDELELAGSSQEIVVQTILDQLQAPNVEEKYCGLQTFAMLIEDQSRLQELLSSDVIKAAAPLIIDGALSVRNSAAGALNNLSRCGFEVCESMMEQDIMTPLVAYFHEHGSNLTAHGNSSTKYNEESETFVQCVSMLLNLCESSELALKYFNTSNLLSILMKYLDFSTFGSDVTISALQCLFVVSEDNVAVTETIKTEGEDKLQKLLQIEENEPCQLLLRTLAAGIIINTCGGCITSLPPETINKIMYILASTLSIDHRQACNQLSGSVPVSDGSRKAKALKGKEGQALDNQIKLLTRLLNAQQTTVEIIANLFSCEDTEDSMDTDSSDSEEACDMGLDCSNNASDQVTLLDKLPPEVLEAMASYELFDKVWAKTVLPPDNTLRILAEYEQSASVCNILSNLQSRSLLCANNMIPALPLTLLGGASGVYRIWVEAGKHAFRQADKQVDKRTGQTDAEGLMESATAVMRSALCRIKTEGAGEGLFSVLSLSDVEMLLTGAKECPVPSIRSNLVRMLGSLALLLTSRPSPQTEQVVAVVTGFIIDLAHKENEVWVLAECVDTLLDLYSEDDTDELAARTGLVDKLAHLAPVLKNKARQQRKSLGEHSILVHTATSNLPRFIKYKRDRLSKLAK